MKISVRTLKQEKYEFECEPTDTIEHLKDIIFAKLGHEKDWQTLIFSGVLLANDRTIESCKISEKDFLVLMVKKPAQKKPEPEKKDPAPQPTQPQPQPTQPVQPQPTQPVQPTQPQQPAQQAGGNAVEVAISNLVDMGFPRPMVVQAMQAARNNPDIAVSILTGDLPFGMGGQGGGQGGGLDIGEDDEDDEDDDIGGLGLGQGQGGVFDALKNTPQFQQLRILARQNPAMLEQILSQLPRNIVELISQNQEEFLRVLQEDPILPQGQAQQQQAQPQHHAQPQGGMPQQVQVRVTPEDQAVIQNLMEMTGCDKNKVMQAYFLFEKDAETAANYLLNHGFDDEEAFGGGGGM